jgi:hypothetical protein
VHCFPERDAYRISPLDIEISYLEGVFPQEEAVLERAIVIGEMPECC